MNRYPYLRRAGSFMIDLMICAAPSAIITVLLNFFGLPHLLDNVLFYLAASLFLLKDVVSQNGSIGKNILGIKIDFDSTKAILIRKVLRNITLIIWPLECLIVVVTKRRLGDYLVGSRVVKRT